MNNPLRRVHVLLEAVHQAVMAAHMECEMQIC